MKKTMLPVIIIAIISLLFGCSASQSNGMLIKQDVPSFSYSETLKIYKENSPGVKFDGFNNTSETELRDTQDVINRAKNECTVNYDTIEVSGYDRATDMWWVSFYTEGAAGGSQSVYLDSNGITHLTVSEE